MARTQLHVFRSPDAIGEDLAPELLQRIERARIAGRGFLLGCPTGRTPRPIYAAMARRLAKTRQDLSHLSVVMMDEYLVRSGAGFEYASADNPWTCHHFVRAEIADWWNAALPLSHQLRDETIWFPDPRDPAAYDARIADAGRIDFFILASGASDGHVAFNPPGSSRNSRTRIIALSEETRRDNLQTFPEFGTLNEVPTHGASVGIDTIASAKECVMIVWGPAKRLTLKRILDAEHFEPDWPATVVHECATRRIMADTDAAVGAPAD